MNVQIINGISSVVHAEFCEVYLGEGKMVDFKFLNDDILLALFYPEGTSARFTLLLLLGPLYLWVADTTSNRQAADPLHRRLPVRRHKMASSHGEFWRHGLG